MYPYSCRRRGTGRRVCAIPVFNALCPRIPHKEQCDQVVVPVQQGHRFPTHDQKHCVSQLNDLYVKVGHTTTMSLGQSVTSHPTSVQRTHTPSCILQTLLNTKIKIQGLAVSERSLQRSPDIPTRRTSSKMGVAEKYRPTCRTPSPTGNETMHPAHTQLKDTWKGDPHPHPHCAITKHFSATARLTGTDCPLFSRE
mgnify:CR=1 FL=1